MNQKITDLIFSATGKDTAIVTLGTAINVILGGLFFIIVPRVLGPGDYGLFSTVVATGILATSVANLGIDTGILRFIKKDSNRSDKYLSIALKSYIFLGIVIALLGFLISPLISQFLKQEQITNLLRIAFASTIILLLTNLYTAALQAKHEFTKASVISIASNLLRLVILAICALFLNVGLILITALFFTVPIISVILGSFFLPIKLTKTDKTNVIDFHKYNLWIALSLIVTSIPFDNYLLLKLSGPAQAGIYAAPYKILTFVYQFSSNFTRVLASRFSSFDTNAKAKEFALKSSAFLFLFTIGLVLLILIASPLVNAIFGQDFQGSAVVFKWLTAGFIFFFASTIPTSIILYYLGKSQVTFFISTVKIIIFVMLLFILIGAYQAVGAAMAFTLAEIFSFLTSLLYVLYKLR